LASNSSLQEKLRQGIEAARKGEKTAAQKLLRQVTSGDPGNEVAWMWLASVSETLQERRQCLERAIRINPENTRAKEALRQLGAPIGGTPARSSNRGGGGVSRSLNVGSLSNVGDRLSGINPGYIIVAAVAFVLLVGILIFSSVVNTQPPTPNAATQQAIIFAGLVTNTPTAVAVTATATAGPSPTPFGVVFVTPKDLATLPPSFTPTFTYTPSNTPLPSITPYPMAAFVMVYSSIRTGETQPGLYQAKGDGTGDQPLGSADEGFRDVAYDPSGQNIAFVRTVTYKKDDKDVTAPELFIAPLNNIAGAKQLTQLGGKNVAHPTWAPDGIQLVFVSDASGEVNKLWYITEDGNNLRTLTSGKWADSEPAWSPAGNIIVYASEQANKPGSGLTEIFSVTSDGKTVTQLTNANNSSYSPSWSPDGSMITFASDRSGKSNIYVMDADGQRPTLLTAEDGKTENRSPVFTPDGKHIVFTSNRDGKSFQLYLTDLKGNEITRLTDNGRDTQSVTFRPEPLLKLQQK
jgi:TolB protein